MCVVDRDVEWEKRIHFSWKSDMNPIACVAYWKLDEVGMGNLNHKSIEYLIRYYERVLFIKQKWMGKKIQFVCRTMGIELGL